MTTDCPEKNVNYKPDGKRNIGRLQTRWVDDFWEDDDDDLTDLCLINYVCHTLWKYLS